MTWLCAGLFFYQSTQFADHTPLPHPIETFIEEGQLEVDALSITVVSALHGPPLVHDLSFLKSMASGVTGSLQTFNDVPQNWELIAEANDGYRSVRYEGRGLTGTHWVISAYQLDDAETTYVALRKERRGLPEDVRLTSYQLRQSLHSGAGHPLKHLETRLAVSGRSRASQSIAARAYAETLIDSVGLGGAVHLREQGAEVWASGYSPYLPRTESGRTNIELHLVPEGDATRVTFGTPHLGEVERSLASGRPYAYTSLSYGQTMAKEVR